MKKIVITIAAVVFAAVAVKAQSPGVEVRGMDACLGGYWSKSRTASTSASVKTNKNKQNTNLEKKVARKVERAEAQNTKKQAPKAAKQIAKNAKPAPKKPAKKAPAKTGAVNNANAGQWFAAAWTAPYSGRPSARYWIDLAK